MIVTESLDSTTTPPIGNASPYCICGSCLADGNYSDTELALDAGLTHMLDLIRIVETSTRKARRRTWVSLRVLHELIGDARRLLCAQRQTTRALVDAAQGSKT